MAANDPKWGGWGAAAAYRCSFLGVGAEAEGVPKPGDAMGCALLSFLFFLGVGVRLPLLSEGFCPGARNMPPDAAVAVGATKAGRGGGASYPLSELTEEAMDEESSVTEVDRIG